MRGPSSLNSPPASDEPSEPDPRVGTVLAERYRLDALLGEGGMGRVYAAEHVLMRKRLAVKILHRELTTVPEVVARFEREAMAAANIDHPNVAAATDFGKLVDGAVFLVLEYVQGENLRDQIAAGPMPTERTLRIGRQIALALASAHALNIVHRDLKPENVMLVEKGSERDFVKVLDFGIAKVPIGEVKEDGVRRPITKVGMVFGTPEYMAPEQALGQNVDGRADLYALGVILYEMLTGVRPFSSQSQVGILGQQLSKPPPSFAERAPGIHVPPAVEQLVVKLLHREVTQRFQSAAEVARSISELLGAPVRGARMFTLAGGSPRAFGSRPDLGSAPDASGSRPDLGSAPDASGSRPDLGSAPDAFLTAPLGSAVGGSGGDPLPRFPDASDSWPEIPGAKSAVRAGAALGSDPLGSAPIVNPLATLSRSGWMPHWQDRAHQLVLILRRTIDRLSERVDSERQRLPEAVRVPLNDVPTRALLAFGLALGLALLIGFVALVSSLVGSHHGASASKSPVRAAASGTAAASAAASAGSAQAPVLARNAASDAEIASARRAGPTALLKLSLRYPKDTRVMLELAKADVAHHAPAQAVSVVGRALAVDPALNTNPEVASLLWVTAQTKKSEKGAFALLEGPMGAKGADIVYDLSMARGVARSVTRPAEQWLHTQQFQKNSSPALDIAVALRFARECSQRHALLLRAKAVGDQRSLPYLEALKSRTGCGRGAKSDCNACLRGDDRLKEAIAAAQQRKPD